MKEQHNCLDEVNFLETCGLRAVRWEDEGSRGCWLCAVEEAVKDLLGAARDRSRSKHKRVLSRAEARRQIDASGEELVSLIEAAKRGFGKPPQAPEPSREGGGEDAPPLSGKRPRSTPPDEVG